MVPNAPVRSPIVVAFDVAADAEAIVIMDADPTLSTATITTAPNTPFIFIDLIFALSSDSFAVVKTRSKIEPSRTIRFVTPLA
jgi:hypothetical protein